MEPPHSLASLFGANENGCRVSRSKNGEGGGSKDTRARGLKEGGRWLGESRTKGSQGRSKKGRGKVVAENGGDRQIGR